MKRPMIEYIIEALEPTFSEQLTSENEGYWHSYTSVLDHIATNSTDIGCVDDKLISGILAKHFTSGQYNAACDVASCLEGLCPEEYAGKFRY